MGIPICCDEIEKQKTFYIDGTFNEKNNKIDVNSKNQNRDKSNHPKDQRQDNAFIKDNFPVNHKNDIQPIDFNIKQIFPNNPSFNNENILLSNINEPAQINYQIEQFIDTSKNYKQNNYDSINNIKYNNNDENIQILDMGQNPKLIKENDKLNKTNNEINVNNNKNINYISNYITNIKLEQEIQNNNNENDINYLTNKSEFNLGNIYGTNAELNEIIYDGDQEGITFSNYDNNIIGPILEPFDYYDYSDKKKENINIIQEIKKDDIFINIIYLLDLTYSMKKYECHLNCINHINQSLKEKYKNISFGYVFYRDFQKDEYILQNYREHIYVDEPSPSNDYITMNYFTSALMHDSEEPRSVLRFEGGEDYAEDWANSYYKISQLKVNVNYENIVIHICDAGAHGKRFSDYDDNNGEEYLLILALKLCSVKKFKIIGLLFNEFSRKSFMECQYIYNSFGGYYNIIDISYLPFSDIDLNVLLQENIKKALKNEINENTNDYTKIIGFESNFDYINEKFDIRILNIQMLNLKEIKKKI